MKKLILLLTITLLTIVTAMAQKKHAILTIEDVDSLVIAQYESHKTKFKQMEKKFTTLKTDKQKLKLSEQYEKFQVKSNTDLLGIYAEYINIEGATQRLFTSRMSIEKSELEKIYKKLPESTKQKDPYAKSLKTYIKGYQIAKGDTIGSFNAITARANQFAYSEFKNEKDILLIFGNLESSTIDMKLMLQVLYRKVDIAKLEFVSVFNAKDPKDLTLRALNSGLNWLIISDFKGDHSPLSIAFGVYAEPMAFYISKGGCVESISLGLGDEIQEKIADNSFE